jgi:hypothetical protein
MLYALFADNGSLFVPQTPPMLAVKPSPLHGDGVFAREEIASGCRVGVLRGKEVSSQDVLPMDHGHCYRGKSGKIYNAFIPRLNVMKNSNHSCKVM